MCSNIFDVMPSGQGDRPIVIGLQPVAFLKKRSNYNVCHSPIFWDGASAK